MQTIGSGDSTASTRHPILMIRDPQKLIRLNPIPIFARVIEFDTDRTKSRNSDVYSVPICEISTPSNTQQRIGGSNRQNANSSTRLKSFTIVLVLRGRFNAWHPHVLVPSRAEKKRQKTGQRKDKEGSFLPPTHAACLCDTGVFLFELATHSDEAIATISRDLLPGSLIEFNRLPLTKASTKAKVAGARWRWREQLWPNILCIQGFFLVGDSAQASWPLLTDGESGLPLIEQTRPCLLASGLAPPVLFSVESIARPRDTISSGSFTIVKAVVRQAEDTGQQPVELIGPSSCQYPGAEDLVALEADPNLWGALFGVSQVVKFLICHAGLEHIHVTSVTRPWPQRDTIDK
ncbi:hypothetical protein WN51_03486 [Melipona quadrifasciata]|uniref:Uncharacterized protein n=1 Tax=Melipona quadrifasciata TaxID=166423 RepID=A0A0N1ITA0_9HYME|nr:hypothetical protein WN51_03486 [Melipona quadrifasciata]